MHESTHRVAWMMAALVISLSAGSIAAGPLPASPSAPRPVVVRAEVDQLEPDRLVIRGSHFGGPSAPMVLLAKVQLDVLSFSDEQIVARLPIDVPSASYVLQVVANGAVSAGVSEVTLGRRPPHTS
jgi:hypothetical protein